MNEPQATKPVNAYWIYTYPIPYYEPVYYAGDYLGSVREDDVVSAAIVVAETRGKAKSQFQSHFSRDGVEYMDIEAAYVLAKDVDYEPGVMDNCPYPPHSHPLWALVADRFWPEYDADDLEAQS